MAITIYRIPLEPLPQRFDIVLGDRSLRMDVRWNPEMTSWTVDIYDGDTDEYIVGCLPLITGLDLLAQHRHLGLPGELIVATDGDELATPTETNLGAEANLYHVIEQ